MPTLPLNSPGLSYGLSLDDRWLLNYWVEQLSTLISVAPRHGVATPFQRHLTAMAYESPALRSTILSMAANHLALTSNNASLHLQGYRFQRNAIRELQQMIQDPVEIDAEPALATVMMMQVSARLFGDDDEAHVANHLIGAKAMISRHEGDGWLASSNARFLMSLLAYHDILSSVSRGSQPLLDHKTGFTAVEGEQQLESIANVLLVVAQISQLQHAIKMRKAEDFLISFEMIRFGDNNLLPSMEHINQCLSQLQQVDAHSPLTSSHIWPLFTAGCEAIDSTQRHFVRIRFEELYAVKRFPSLKRVMRDIEHVWEAKDMEQQTKGQAGMAKVDCIQVILKRRGREVELA